MPPVTTYGLDYSARELLPHEIDDYNRRNPDQRIGLLLRYIGYPTNRKCISHYPGALRRHEETGRTVILVHQVAYNDFAGGRAAGRNHARIAWADAREQGYPANRPIFFAFDRWLAGNPALGVPPLSLGTVWDYLAGAKDELGHDRVGLYGFYDVIHPAVRERRVRWTWLCGSESNVIDGVSLYQWNNGRVYPGGLECDLNKSYVDLAEFGGKCMADWNNPATKAAFDDGYWRTVAMHDLLIGAPTPDGKPQLQRHLDWYTEELTRRMTAMFEVLADLIGRDDVTPDVVAESMDRAVARNSPTPEQVAAVQMPIIQTAVSHAVRQELGADTDATEGKAELVKAVTGNIMASVARSLTEAAEAGSSSVASSSSGVPEDDPQPGKLDGAGNVDPPTADSSTP